MFTQSALDEKGRPVRDAASTTYVGAVEASVDFGHRIRAEAMRYGAFRAKALFVGSGVVEAGCKTVIGRRLKQSGMFWSLAGANAIIALRCCLKSQRFEQFWEDAA